MYNYLPENIRGQFGRIPYLGSLFTLMNYINPYTVRAQNSAAVVITIYYLLRNAGIDTDNSIATIGSTAQALIGTCSRQLGRFVCSTADLITNSVSLITDTLANRLRVLLTQNYNDSQSSYQSSQLSQGSQSSTMTSISSNRSVDISKTGDSIHTEASVQSIRLLLNTPVSEGGIDIDVNNIQGEIVEQRLVAIASVASEEVDSNPIIPEDPELPESLISDITGSDSQIHWSVWLYGNPSNDDSPNSGGKKTRRYKKTRKHSTKKHRITRRQKKYKKRISKKHVKRVSKKNYKSGSKRK
jgi:hypothetical protein